MVWDTREHGENTFMFTEETLASFRRVYPLTSADIRYRIGQYLLKQLEEYDDPPEFNLEAIAQAIKVEPQQVVGQIRVLKGRELIREYSGVNIGSFDEHTGKIEWAHPHQTYVSLTEPAGLDWALQDAADASPPAVRVNVGVEVAVHVNINTFIKQIDALPLPEKDKEELRTTAQKLETNPTWELFQELMGFGANSLVVLPAILRLILDNADVISSL